MVFRIRVIWAQSFYSANDNGPTESQDAQSTTTRASQVDSNISLAFPLAVYHDGDEWRKQNEALLATFTPEMKLMRTVDGYDMIEDLDSVSTRGS
jgi:hypothetical protein